MNKKRVFISVSGGVVDDVYVPAVTDGTYTVIDWDNIEADAEREWNQFDDEDKAYIKETYPDAAEFFPDLK